MNEQRKRRILLPIGLLAAILPVGLQMGFQVGVQLIVQLALVTHAEAASCSTPLRSNTPTRALPGHAQLSMFQARAIALSFLGRNAVAVRSSELEVERQCLVYSFDVHMRGKSGIDEVLVDAGNGKVLSHSHEDAAAEARERAQEALTRATRSAPRAAASSAAAHAQPAP